MRFILQIIVQIGERGGKRGSRGSRRNSLRYNSSRLKKPPCDTEYITLLSVFSAIDDVRWLLFSSRLCYYSLLGCLPVVRVNHSCPCWCTLLFGVQTKVTNPLKSKKGHYLLLLMQRSIRLFTTTLCVLTWNMFDWGMMNGIRYEIDVPKCGKDKQCSAGRYWEFKSLMSAPRSCSVCDPSRVLRESLIIKTRLLVSEQQCTLYYA